MTFNSAEGSLSLFASVLRSIASMQSISNGMNELLGHSLVIR